MVTSHVGHSLDRELNGAKHSPRRFRLGGPEGPFQHFQRKKVIFRFFRYLWRRKYDSEGSWQMTSLFVFEFFSEMPSFLPETHKLVEPLVAENFFCDEKFMFGMNTVYFKFGHLQLNFERNQDQQ